MSIYERTTFEPGEVGIIESLSMQTYRDAPGIAGSDLEIIQRSPAEFKRGERREPTQEMEFGTLFHSLLFSGDADFYTVPETYVAPESTKKDAPLVAKAWNWNATACKEWRDRHQDRPIIPRHGSHSSTWLKAMQMKCEVNDLARELISLLTPEVSIFARHEGDGLLCKGRLDGLIRAKGKTIIVELKTTRDCSTRAFSREVWSRGYYRKAAWYRMLLHQMKVSPVEYWFIAIEKGDHPRVNVRQLAERAMDKGDFDNDDALTLYRKCRTADFWPELPDDEFPGENLGTPFIDLPDFAYGAEVEQLQGLTEIEEEKSA